MKKWLKTIALATSGLLILALVAINVVSRREAQAFVRATVAEREQRRVDEAHLRQTPEAYGLQYEAVTVTSADGLSLVGWYVPGTNGAAVMLLHGYEEMRYHLLEEAAMLQRHGYGALLLAVRAHDASDGELVSFGCGDREMADLEAFYRYLAARDEVDPTRIGVLGQSMGGSLVIQYARRNPAVRAIVAHSALPSVDATVEKAVTWKTGLPGPLFAPFMLFWAERDIDCDLRDVNAIAWVADLSPRPVLVLNAGRDDVVPEDGGRLLYAAAGEPKGWFDCPECGHHELDTYRPQEFEARVVGFFDQYLGP